MTVATIATGNHFVLDAVGAVAVLAVARIAVVGVQRWRGATAHSPHDVARRAQVALLGVILVVWVPRGQWTALAGILLVLATVEAARQHAQGVPAWQAHPDMMHEEAAGADLRPALPEVG